jgi:5-hydroxyisourate hydrolase
MTRVSTHMLDLQTGRPASGITVRLERLGPDGADLVGTAVTDGEGRVEDLGGGVGPGDHLITFETTDHPFYPEVAVVFRVGDGDDHLHLPLLLSRYGYTTYRGS